MAQPQPLHPLGAVAPPNTQTAQQPLQGNVVCFPLMRCQSSLKSDKLTQGWLLPLLPSPLQLVTTAMTTAAATTNRSNRLLRLCPSTISSMWCAHETLRRCDYNYDIGKEWRIEESEKSGNVSITSLISVPLIVSFWIVTTHRVAHNSNVEWRR